MNNYKIITSNSIIKQELEKIAIYGTFMKAMVPTVKTLWKAAPAKTKVKYIARRAKSALIPKKIKRKALGLAGISVLLGGSLGADAYGQYKKTKPKIPGMQ